MSARTPSVVRAVVNGMVSCGSIGLTPNASYDLKFVLLLGGWPLGQAQAGLIKLTGVSAPYEEPTDADISIDTSSESVSASVTKLLQVLEAARYVRPDLEVATAAAGSA